MSEAQATLYDKTGLPLTDVISTFERSWVLNDWGECRFSVAVKELNSNPEFYENGNFILVQQDDLEDWVGYIDTPQQHGNKMVSFSAFSAERLLELRPAKRKGLVKGSAGALFTEAIRQYNLWGDSLLTLGEIYTEGRRRQNFFAPSKLILDEIIQISARSDDDFDVTPDVRRGLLRLEGNWYNQKGSVKDYALAEGFNIDQGSVSVEYEGEIRTAVFAFGNERTWKDRVTYYIEDDEAVEKYGLRILPFAVDSNDEATVRKTARSVLRYVKSPNLRLEFFCAPVSFPWLRVGNILDVEIFSVGFQDGKIGIRTAAKIVEVIYQHFDNAARVIVEEYRE